MVQVKAYSKMTVCPLPANGRYKGAEFESLSWDQFHKKYGFNEARRNKLALVYRVLDLMKKLGYKIKEVSIFGSFVTDKENPKDLDIAIWHDSPPIDPGNILDAHELATEYGVDLFVVRSLKDYCSWLSGQRPEIRSNRVVRLTSLPRTM